MLIFIFTPSYPNEINPVANIFVKEQAVKLSDFNNQIVILTIKKQPTKNIFNRIDHNIHCVQDQKIHIVSLQQKTLIESKFHFLNQFWINRSFKRLYDFAKDKFGDPDVIYAHFFSSAYAAVQLNTEIPIVAMEHDGNIMNNNMSTVEKHFLKIAVEHSNTYIATTDKLKESIVKHTNTKKEIHVIPNMVDDLFSFKDTQRKKEFTFFSLCRLTYDKRIDLLVDAFCKAFSANDAVVLYIGGNGKEYENIKKLIESNKRKHQIFMLGALNRIETFNQYASCDCFVLPSRHETFGLVWREAMCVGRPVISTEHGGFSSSDFNKSFGEMIPVDDLVALIEALRFVRKNYDNYDLREISCKNRLMYSSEVVARRIESVLIDSVTI